MDDRVWTGAAEQGPVRRGLGRGLAAIIPARAANASGLLPHLGLGGEPPVHEGLLRRGALTERLDAILAEATSEGASVAVVVLGLDGFRHVNNRVGQQAGDGLLRAVGDRLASGRRAGDAVAQLDGDVFAVVCPRVASVGAGAKVIGRLAVEVGRPLEVAGAEERLGATFGLALAGERPEIAGRVLLRRAEMAMLRAKDEGVAWSVYETEPGGLTSGPGGTPRPATGGAGEPRPWVDRRLLLGR
ncbi:MAG: GGDEF domain-containing protein [Acidobacteriota bacterium]|nr:GGDEF domain-containing protein [Acidobacteriota bacterium]